MTQPNITKYNPAEDQTIHNVSNAALSEVAELRKQLDTLRACSNKWLEERNAALDELEALRAKIQALISP